MDFSTEFELKKNEVEQIIGRFLPREEGAQKTVIEAMNYSILAGGKRLRPMLMLETYRLFGGKADSVYPLMAAIEMIHNYSLVHDDLPAMDNDEYRRGRKTTHAVYGEAMGILAGDALLNYAMETALMAFPAEPGNSHIAESLFYLFRKAGIFGMIGGQTADIEAEQNENATQETLLIIHEHKTAALIQAAMCCGAILAGASSEDVARVEKIAYNVGVSFQIQDDILDVTGDFAQLGKPIGSDAQNHKTTYVTLNGLEKSKEEVSSMTEEAVSLLKQLPGDKEFLEALLMSLIDRQK